MRSARVGARREHLVTGGRDVVELAVEDRAERAPLRARVGAVRGEEAGLQDQAADERDAPAGTQHALFEARAGDLPGGREGPPPSVERARKVAPVSLPTFVRGTITSTTPGAGSSTLTREAL